MIKTKYNAKISIDDKEFNVVVSEPSLAQRKELEIKASEQKAKLDELSAINLQREELSLEIANKEKILSINTELLSTLNAQQKAELLKENKSICADILGLKKQASKLSAQLKSGDEINAQFEKLMEYKALMLVSGADKDELFALIKERGIAFSTLWSELNEAVLKDSQKK
nr:hypothetical protein [uncultured Campylobacter sp.]